MPNFAELVDKAVTPGNESLRPVIEKELLHYDILIALDREGLLNDLTFQGGTSLRLCYGSPRFSEDLDFVGGFDFSSKELSRISDCVMDHIGARYGLEVLIKQPDEMSREPTYWGLKTDRWQVAVITNPGRPDLARQKIKLEVANVPAHTSTLRGLERNYGVLPAGYQDLLVPVETIGEIMADKVVSLSSCRHYPRHRDIWDLLWLSQKGAEIDPDLVRRKISDYRSEDFETYIHDMISNIGTLSTSKEFMDEMSRFVEPASRQRTLDRAGFVEYLGDSVRKILVTARDGVYGPEKVHEFTM